jgi:RNA-directed DNA polymerase
MGASVASAAKRKRGGKNVLNKVTMESVVERENLTEAYRKVKANGGGPGVDRMNATALKAHFQKHQESIIGKLLAGKYKPAAVKAVDIPKGNGGGTRTLGIPTTLDRTIQQAILNVIGPVCDIGFSENSYGFRPNRSAHDAVRKAQEYVLAGKKLVVDIDLKNFFDQVNHDRLMTMLGQKVRDKTLLALIAKYLKAPMQKADGSKESRRAGTPQGGPLSPLLANIYLDPLDKELEKRGLSFVRYADDLAIFVSSSRSAERILESLGKWLKKILGLEVNLEKSGTGPVEKSSLLGFQLYEDGRIGIAPKAISKIKEKIREMWNARRSITSKNLSKEWQSYIRGWWNYFQLANWRWDLKRLGEWMRRHMRKCFWLRWKRPKGRINALRKLGIKGKLLGIAYSGRGAWAIAKNRVMHRALTNKTLNKYGFITPWDFTKTTQNLSLVQPPDA